MKEYLLFQLYGPLASWGEIAVGETRSSAAHPSKSAILGLVAAALGVDREDEGTHRQLAEDYKFGVRVDASGEVLRDYHTSQVPPQRKNVNYFTRREETNADDLYTILSSRDYRSDCFYTVALWCSNNNASVSIQEIENSLKNPRYVPYLGRKCCVISLPFAPQIVKSDTLKTAFDSYKIDELSFAKLIFRFIKSRKYYWENDDNIGMESNMQFTRRDKILSRKRWQFEERIENNWLETLEE